MIRQSSAASRLNRLANRKAAPFSKQSFADAFRVIAPTLVALTFASAAHAQGTMDFSGAQTLMGTFKRIVESESGLVEGAPLGLWLGDKDDDFSAILEEYLRAYTDWLAQSPEIAAWCDISIVTGFEGDLKTLVIEPDAVMLSPLHPVRIGGKHAHRLQY